MPTDNPKDCRGSWGCGQAGVDSRAGTLNGERAADTEVFMPAQVLRVNDQRVSHQF